jgi:hypothetical protein
MRLSGLGLATLLFLSSSLFAQHSSTSSGGGSSSSSSSSSGGGGSHSSSSSGTSSSASSGSSHNSGGGGGSHVSSGSSSSHISGGGSASHVSTTRGAKDSGASHLVGREPLSNTVHSNHELNRTSQARTAQPEKRSFLSFLRHPFRKPEPKPKPVSDLRRRVCLTGPCPVCPKGQVAGAGGCGVAPPFHGKDRRYCSSTEVWSGGACLQETRFLDDCSGLRMALQRQAQRLRAAESLEQSACAAGSTQGCSDSTSARQSEDNLYRSLQARYRQCQQRSTTLAYPLRGHAFSAFGSSLMFDPLSFEVIDR